MLCDLSPPQRELAEYMSGLSERAFAAGWIERLEFMLWAAISGATADASSLRLTEQETFQLRRLSERCSGWVYFHERTEETFVSIDQWRAIAAQEAAK